MTGRFGSSGFGSEPLIPAETTMEGGSQLVATASVSPTLEFTGESSMTADGSLAMEMTVTMAGSSELGAHPTSLGAYGDDSYGGGPYGGALPSFGLESATALSSTQIRIRYTAMFDAGFLPLLSVSNYSVSPPFLINSIVVESAQSVVLNTSPLDPAVYTVVISDARGYFGQPLYLPLNTVQFTGLLVGPSFYAVATGKNRVRAVFSQLMLSNASLLDAAQYRLTDLSGDPVPIVSVTAEQLSDVRSTVLHLGEDLVDERHYRVTLLGGFLSQDLATVSPDSSMFQWVANTLRAQIPVAHFSGEVVGGGSAFFSPALENPASDSIIQVEQVDVCTRAYDEYHFPPQVDPRPRSLMTHGSSVTPTPIVSTLNSADWVLWVTFPRVGVKFELGMGMGATTPLEDLVPLPVDELIEISLDETWPPDRVAILNNVDWKLFDNLGTPPAYFITADNLTPFP